MDALVIAITAPLIVALTGFLGRQIWSDYQDRKAERSEEAERVSTTITLRIPDQVNRLEPTFSVLMVREGRDGVDEAGTLLNTVVGFAPPGAELQKAELKHRPKLGLQFKCYVEFPPSTRFGLSEVQTRLAELDVHGVRPDGDRSINRWWFLLNQYGTTQTSDTPAFENNFLPYNPSA